MSTLPSRRPRLGVTSGSEGDRVTTLELFFDLVFVFAFTQVTWLMVHGDPPRSLLQGFVVLSLLWWAWSSYAWLANQARANRGLLRAAFVVAMIAMFVASLTIPEAFHEVPGGIPAAATLVFCYAVVRCAHLAVYLTAAGGDKALRGRVVRTAATSVAPTVAILAVGAAIGEPWQTWIWLGAVGYDFAAIYLGARAGGWVVQSAAHFAERHGLVVILALGESIVAVGVGVSGTPLSWSVITGGVLAITIAVGLWWQYFHHRFEQLEHALESRQGDDRARLASEVFTYLHFPLIAGIILTALGLEQAMAHISDDHLGPLGGWALAGGLTCALLASALTIVRTGGTIPRLWWASTAVVLASGALLTLLPPVWALALAAFLVALFCASDKS
ncbi:low temperature requirement protein A [Saccharothrix sp. NRRL B-16314]|uniref:low temperature requirement protein A n=1 Tax=Saccharothrix sp. NRRL B-16314 TaxID=1463825 RepID=UPI0007C57620|nr:low temperature requirement protein A [Saccharothrix sp. NRRL B-16314]